MPFTCRKVSGRYIVHKKDENGGWVRLKSSGSHGSMKSCQRQVRSMYANESAPQAADTNIIGIIKEPINLKEEGTVRINSPGGDLLLAIEAANTIREKGLATLVTGQAASAAALAAIAGKPARMMSNTLLMIHNPRAMMQGVFTAEELKDKAEAIEKAIEIYANEIRARVSPMAALSVDEWLKKDTYFTAEEALACGLIDEIVPVHSRNVDVSLMANLPDRIVAFLSDKESEEEKMALLDVAEKFGIEASDNADNEAVEQGIIAFVEDLQTKFADLEKKFEDKSPVDDPPNNDPIPSGFVAMAKKFREQEFSGIIAEGKVAPCVVEDLKAVFCTDTALQAALSDDGTAVDNFDKIIAALKKNEAIISFGGETSAQRQQHLKGGDNPLLKDVDKRRKEAGMQN